METRTGNVSINSDNMLPIIKKWLYSDKDIFIREVISNGCDAISKLHKLEMMGEYQYPDKFKDAIHVIVNPNQKTLKFVDTGLGMTAEEVEKYITQIAFSGATAFFEQYKDKANKDDIIGHFGLGFYSVFMVSDLVTIDTLSYVEGATPVHWECDGGDTYTIGDGDRKEVGTCVTLHLSEDNLEFANEYRVREVLERYCSFMPIEIFLDKEGAPQEYEEVKPEEVTEDDVVVENVHHDAITREEDDGKGGKKTIEVEPEREMVKIQKRPVSISDIHPLWQKTPSQCTDEEYKDFYRKVFNDYREPLFWIHLNMDYPFNMKGILYFPKINTEVESIEGTIKLYSNQVFVADNIKEIVPEYLVALKGIVDCPDFPLNVSRSALQNDGFVKKMSDYIAKKVADKISGMCKTKREDYEKYWDDINPFIKYGCLRDQKFADHMQDAVLYKDIDGTYYTLKEYLDHVSPKKDASADANKAADGSAAETGTVEGAGSFPASGEEVQADETVDFSENPEDMKKESDAKSDEQKADELMQNQKDSDQGTSDEGSLDPQSADVSSSARETAEQKKDEKTIIYYVTDETQQGQYIRLFRQQKLDAVVMKMNIDTPFISKLEQENENLSFRRIDADLTGSLKEEGDEASLKKETEDLQKLFKDTLKKERLTVKVENLKDDSISSVLTLSEEGRRMQEMMKMYSQGGSGMDTDMFAPDETLTLNANNQIVRDLAAHQDGPHAQTLTEQLYDLAKIAAGQMKPDEMAAFLKRSNEILMLLADESGTGEA